MQDTRKKEYVEPTLEKRDNLKEITQGDVPISVPA